MVNWDSPESGETPFLLPSYVADGLATLQGREMASLPSFSLESFSLCDP